MEDFKGKVLLFEERNYNSTLRGFQQVINSANAVGECYEELDTTFRFTQEVFEDIIANGTKNISDKYALRIDEQIKNTKLTSKAIINSMRENVTVEMANLSEKIKAMHEAQEAASAGVSSYPVELEFIQIKNGKAVLNAESKEAIREIFTVRIRTEEQNKLYNLLLALKESYENLSAFLSQGGIDLGNWGEIISDTGNGLCYEKNGQLEIDPYSLNIKLKAHGSTIEE